MAMTITISKDRSGPGYQAELLQDLNLLIKKGADVERTDEGVAVFGYGSAHTARIDGRLIGDQGIALGNERAVDNSETVIVGKTGHIDGDSVGINIAAWGSKIANAGAIKADFGVFLGGISADTTTTIANSGTINGKQAAIYVDSSTTETIQFTNTGKVLGSKGYYATDATLNADIVINKGFIAGSVYLGGGDDTYTGTKGEMGKYGVVAGLSGNDSLSGGKKFDNFYGGDGDDQLSGGKDGDNLAGQAGGDTLIGGAGKDYFLYMYLDDSTANSADTIVDFKKGDHVQIDMNTFDDSLENDPIDFVFIGAAAFSGTKGEIRFEVGDENTTIFGDFDGNGVADFVVNVLGKYEFSEADFLFF